MKKVVKALMVMFMCLTQLMPLQSMEQGGIIGVIDQNLFGVEDVPSGPIYGKAQMQYEFTLDNGEQRVDMGGNHLRGIAYLNTAQGSVYCIDPTTGACGSVGDAPADSYSVEPYENELADAMGLIWYYGNQQHAHDANYMDYVAVTQLMIWELYGWHAELIRGFDNYQTIRDEIEANLNAHQQTPQWEVKSIQLNPDNYADDEREDAVKINLQLGEKPSFTLKPGDSIVLDDLNGVFEKYYTDWLTIPAGIKTERVGKNGIRFTALSSFKTTALGYTRVDPQVIGHAYLLKPKNDLSCQKLVQPYVSKQNSGRIEFLIGSEGSAADWQSPITYPEFVKVDAEHKIMPLPGSLYQLFSSQSIKVPFERRTMTCSVNAEGETNCSDERITHQQETIFKTNEMLLEMVTDQQGQLDLSLIGSLFEQRVMDQSYDHDLANGGYESYAPADDYEGFNGGKFYLSEKQAFGQTGSYIGYYNDGKRISFTIDANADQRKITAVNTRQKAKLILHKADADDLYLNHNDKLLPQGDASFANAVFELRADMDITLLDGTILYERGDLVDTIRCDAFGVGESAELELGRYTLKEISLPEGYWYYQYADEAQRVTVDIRYTGQEHSLQIYTYDKNELGDTSPFEAVDIHELSSDDPQQSLIYRNSVQKGHLMITKFYEGEVGNESAGMPAAKKPAADIYFGIYLNSKAVNNLTADLDDAFFMAKQLDGTYKNNKGTALQIAKDHELALCDVYMVIKSDVNGEASTQRPESIVYAATHGAMQKDETITKPLPLPYGKYTVIELNTPEGYKPLSFQFEVAKVSGEQAADPINKYAIVAKRQLLENQPSMQKITLSKRDAETGSLIVSDDTVFKIWQWNYDELFSDDQIRSWWDDEEQKWHIGLIKRKDQLLSGSNQQVWLDETCGHWIYQRYQTLTGMQILTEYKTSDGSIQLPQPLAVGKYMLCEIKSPQGYQLHNQPLSFVVEGVKHAVDADDPGYIMVPKLDENGQPVLDSIGNIVQVAVPKNIHLFIDMADKPQKGRIVIEKTGSQLIGFQNENQQFKPVWVTARLPYGAVFEISAADDVIVNNQLVYAKGEWVETIVSDIYGNASTHDLPLGTYQVCETASAEGYLTDQTCYEVTLDANHYLKRVFPQFFTVENERQRAIYSFEKLFQTSSGRIPANDVEFGLFAGESLSVSKPVKRASLYDMSAISAADLIYTENEQGITIDAYIGDAKRIEIPNEINAQAVIQIAADAFRGCDLESVLIPGNVQMIGSHAFADNQLELVILQPMSVTFEAADVFADNPLKTLEVYDLPAYDQVKIGFGITASFDPLDGRCLGFALRLHDASDDVLDDFAYEPASESLVFNEAIDPALIQLTSLTLMGSELNVIIRVDSGASSILLPEMIDGVAIDGILSLGNASIESLSIPDSYQYFGENALANLPNLKGIQFKASENAAEAMIIHLNSFDNSPNLAVIEAEASSAAILRNQLFIYDNGELKTMDEFDESSLPSFCLLPITIYSHDNEGGLDDEFTLPPHEEILGKDFVTEIPEHTLIERIKISNGKGIIESQLPPGKYYLKELSAPAGYIKAYHTYEFEVKIDDEGMLNLFAQPLINKAESLPDTPSPASKKHAVKLILYKAFELDLNHPQRELSAEFEIVEAGGKRLDTFTTDASGAGIWQGNLAPGSYTVKEIKTAEGYLVDTRSFNFQVGEKGNDVIVINEGEAVVNRLERHTLKLFKTDDHDMPLKGAEFTLYDAQFESYAKAVTDDLGYAEFSGIKAGTYYLKETKAPAGFIIDDVLKTVELYDDPEMIFINQPGEIMKTYPETGTAASDKSVNEPLLVLCLSAFLFVLIKMLKKSL